MGGGQWEKVNREGKHQFQSRNLFVDANNSQVLFTYREHGDQGLKRSEDGGKHWDDINISPDYYLRDFFEFNKFPAKILRAVALRRDNFDQGLAKQRVALSLDGGKSWTLSKNTIDDENHRVVGICPVSLRCTMIF